MNDRVKRKLACDLTNADRINLSERMSEAVMSKSEHENQSLSLKAQTKSAQAQIDARIIEADSKISECAAILRAGYEFREVECEIVRN